MNEVYEKKRRELIKSMDMSDSQTMFEMHQAISAEWATALADKIDHFAEMGNNGVTMFGQVASQLTQFIDQKEKFFKDAIKLRKFDEAAKKIGIKIKDIIHYKDLLKASLK